MSAPVPIVASAAEAMALATAVPFSELQVREAQTDLFDIQGIHHLGFLVPGGQALPWALRHEQGLGMARLFQSSSATGNYSYASQVVGSGDVRFVFDSPYAGRAASGASVEPFPRDIAADRHWLESHNSGVQRIAVDVGDALEAYRIATERGAKGIMEPRIFSDAGGRLLVSAVMLYTSHDDLRAGSYRYELGGWERGVQLMFIQGARGYDGFFPGYKKAPLGKAPDFGIKAVDHVVLNTFDMMATVRMLERVLGLHVFAIFRDSEIGSSKSSLNSVVMSNNSGTVLLPVNEGVDRTQRSQINEYLLAYIGPGIQHVALRTDRLIPTLSQIQRAGLFPLLEPTVQEYYDDLERRIGKKRIQRIVAGTADRSDYDTLLARLHEMGILVDRGVKGDGVLFQIFSHPLGDDPTLFYEFLQRACDGDRFIPGCGEFGLGNFNQLFLALERAQERRGGSALKKG